MTAPTVMVVIVAVCMAIANARSVHRYPNLNPTIVRGTCWLAVIVTAGCVLAVVAAAGQATLDGVDGMSTRVVATQVAWAAVLVVLTWWLSRPGGTCAATARDWSAETDHDSEATVAVVALVTLIVVAGAMVGDARLAYLIDRGAQPPPKPAILAS